MKRLPITLISILALTALLSGSAYGWGSIAGTVYDETGVDPEPLAGHRVEARLEPNGTAVEIAETDIYGRYTLYELEQGHYYVWACGGDLCVSEWWEDASDPSEADLVYVHDGQLTDNIDFGLYCEAQPGCIEGRVTEEGTGESLVGAIVLIYTDPAEPPVADAVAGDWGYYEVCDLPEGTYYVRAHAENCDAEWYNEKVNPEEADPVEVNGGQSTGGIDFTLTCDWDIYGCIVGKVTNQSTGLPINDAHILVYTNPLGSPIADARSNHQGLYEICELEEGVYYVRAAAEGCEGEWYNNKYNPEEADPVEVVGGEITDHIDFALECVPQNGCIEGRVTDQDTGEPIHEAYVAVYTNPHGDPVAHTYTGVHGYYELCELEPGIYYVMAHAWECEQEWFENRTRPEDADPVEVSAGMVTYGINFTLDCEHPGTGCIIGRVFDEETEEPIAEALVRIYLGDGERPVARAYTGPEGWYEICNLDPGVYYASAHREGCETEWYHNKSSREHADPIEVHAGEIVDGINFFLLCRHPDTGCITGRVTNAEGHPIHNAFVAVVRHPEGDPIRYTHTGENGFYEICQLPPGVYYAFAHAENCEREWYDNKSDPAEADPIEVHAGEVVDRINFSLECVGQSLCISGRVVEDETGEGINDAVVIAVGLDQPWFKYTFSEGDGHYEICGLPHGRYIVFAFAYGYIGEFYDNVYRWEEATPVVPPADGINFSLGKHAFFGMTVSGKVFCRMGPAPRTLVYAYNSGMTATEGVPVSSGLTEIDGSYVIEGLEAGTYVITASKPGDPTTDYPELVTVEGNVDGIDIYLGTTVVRKRDVADPDPSGHLLKIMPNPFRASTQFSVSVPEAGYVRLEVFDLTGRSLAVVLDEMLLSGEYDVEWDAGDITSGVYIAKLSCGERRAASKIVLAR
jgi:hypothetical protein